MYNSADIIFIGKVVGSTHPITQEYAGNGKIIRDAGEIYFDVERYYFNTRKNSRITVYSSGNGAACGMSFVRGESYLVYAYGNNKEGFSTGLCSRTRVLSDATEDISFFEGLSSSQTNGSIFGRVFSRLETESFDMGVFSDLQIRLQQIGKSKEVFNAVSDKNGRFEFSVPAGKYKILPILPNYARLDKLFFREKQFIEIREKGCSQVNFRVKIISKERK